MTTEVRARNMDIMEKYRSIPTDGIDEAAAKVQAMNILNKNLFSALVYVEFDGIWGISVKWKVELWVPDNVLGARPLAQLGERIKNHDYNNGVVVCVEDKTSGKGEIFRIEGVWPRG